jgi:hypothetical protein
MSLFPTRFGCEILMACKYSTLFWFMFVLRLQLQSKHSQICVWKQPGTCVKMVIRILAFEVVIQRPPPNSFWAALQVADHDAVFPTTRLRSADPSLAFRSALSPSRVFHSFSLKERPYLPMETLTQIFCLTFLWIFGSPFGRAASDSKPASYRNLQHCNACTCWGQECPVPGTRSPGRWRLIIVGPPYGACFTSLLWLLEFWSGTLISRKFVHTWRRDTMKRMMCSKELATGRPEFIGSKTFRVFLEVQNRSVLLWTRTLTK